ncbi:MAG: HAMP domain-containing sensor histidine kinase [Rhizobiaceae bacterium]
MKAGTLSRRLFLLLTFWALVSVALIAVLLTEAYRRNAERRFADLVTANLYNLMGAVEPGADGRLSGAPDLRDPRYLRFGSGWYWTVNAVSNPANRLSSPSLADGQIPVPELTAFDSRFQRQFDYVDASAQELSAVEAQVFLGTGSDIFSFRVTGNKDELEDEISAFRGTLILLLSLFGIGFVAVSYLIVNIGLRPLSGAIARLADIREGRAERIEGSYPGEVQPLIDETNALIESNQLIVERARTQVGNLAHSLKTPLAVVRNEANEAPGNLKRILLEQTSLMQAQIQNYLDRARIAARHGMVTSRTDVRATLDRLVRVMAKLNPAISISARYEGDGQFIFAGEQQDFEEILGNLLENGTRFAKAALDIQVSREQVGSAIFLCIAVDDDGPGMSAAECESALKRGVRIDESTPGSGLGLAIVKQIANEYGGAIRLEKSRLGGLSAVVRLPAR